jgi:fructosamine-3-kinase
VHGDLWLGNLGFIGSSAVIFDPACYYGDREVDIAMTELFGYLPQDFYQGYQDTYPLQLGFEQRKIIYNFYHILNHANLFAGHYTDQARAVLSRIMSLTVH